jgi:hypothetical protein
MLKVLSAVSGTLLLAVGVGVACFTVSILALGCGIVAVGLGAILLGYGMGK